MRKQFTIISISITLLISAALVAIADESIYIPVVSNDNESIAISSPTATATATSVINLTSTATPTATATEASPAAPPTDTPTTQTEAWLSSWVMNETGEISSIFSNVEVNVTSVTTRTINGKAYQCIVTSGIPNYETVVTQELIDSLNSRPRASFDFGSGVTTLTVGQTVAFGENIGYDPGQGCTSGSEGYGYWPPGPTCPADQTNENCFPLEPEPTTEVCETGINDMGTWVNGVAIFNWQDTMSFNGAGVWENEAYHFEFYDLDICPGHSANGNYHHHSHPVCLAEQLGDTGNGHSPIYGFGADGYPVYGPWHDTDVLANSCWKTRDYDNPDSATGCGVAGERSCLLVDQYDITQGTVAADSSGPRTDEIVTSPSSNELLATSGYYFQDYYYDAACTEQGIEYMDEHNGHEHDGLGYHYHVTRSDNGDDTFEDIFPFYMGPTYAGTLQDEAIAACDTGQNNGPPPDGGPRPRPAELSLQQKMGR
ncbi:MAG: YHYH protein [Chloroflexota bacterium]